MDDEERPRPGSTGRPTTHPTALEQAAAARMDRDFERLRTEVFLLLSESSSGETANGLLRRIRSRLDGLINTRAQREWIEQQVARISSFNARAVTRSVGMRVEAQLNPRTRNALVKQTLEGVRGVPRDVVTRIAPSVTRAVETGQRGEAFARDIEKRLGVSRKQARKIAVGTVLRANSDLTEQRHKALGIVEYTWRSSPDRFTRRWHRKLNGKRFRYDSPPVGGGGGPHDRGNPGSADRCRCQPIPVIPR